MGEFGRPNAVTGGEQYVRLREWVEDFAVSARYYAPIFNNPGELKSEIRELLAELDSLRERADRAEKERDERRERKVLCEQLEAELAAVVAREAELREALQRVREGFDAYYHGDPQFLLNAESVVRVALASSGDQSEIGSPQPPVATENGTE